MGYGTFHVLVMTLEMSTCQAIYIAPNIRMSKMLRASNKNSLGRATLLLKPGANDAAVTR